jgi:CHAP domain
MSQLTDAALKVAQSQVGQMENPLGSNWGHPVQDYLAYDGINEPASWCMALVYWCFGKACETLGIDPNPLTKTGLVVHAWQVAYPNHKYQIGHAASVPQAGDIFIMDFGNGHGHTGIIESVDADGTLHTIEGNTDDTGSPEGIGVFRRIRHWKAPIVGVLRYP